MRVSSSGLRVAGSEVDAWMRKYGERSTDKPKITDPPPRRRVRRAPRHQPPTDRPLRAQKSPESPLQKTELAREPLVVKT